MGQPVVKAPRVATTGCRRVIMIVYMTLTILSLLILPNAFAQSLDIYFVDVEGGAATLIITPKRESILIDSGWRREDGRDAKRIHQVATKQAGLQEITYLVTTHFHRDHYGAAPRLSRMIPILNFLDSGPRNGLKEDPQFSIFYTEYIRASRGQRQKLKPGEEIPLQQGLMPVRLVCLASDRQTHNQTGSQNPECSNQHPKKEDYTDNARSVGLLLRFGDFEFLDLGDLTWNLEAKLVCPVNVIGTVDAYQVTHHGLETSNNPVLVRSIQPTVAIINNGPKKGNEPGVFTLLKSVESLKDIVQIHLNLRTGAEENTSLDRIANLGPEESCAGHWLRLSVSSDASTFTVTNSRNQLAWTYPVR